MTVMAGLVPGLIVLLRLCDVKSHQSVLSLMICWKESRFDFGEEKKALKHNVNILDSH